MRSPIRMAAGAGGAFVLALALAPAAHADNGSSDGPPSGIEVTITKSTPTMGPGEWDYKGTLTWHVSNGGRWHTNAFKSGGGDVKVCRPSTAPDYNLRTYLVENDPGSGNDDHIPGDLRLPPGYCGIWKGISKYVDGDNNRAEIYVDSGAATTSSSDYLSAWD